MSTLTRCSRYSELPLWSLGGLVPSAARSAAAAGSAPGRQRLLDPARAQRGRAHVREPDVDAAVHLHGADADRGPVLGPPGELLVRPPAARLGHADLRQHLLRVERRLEEAGEALGDRQRALAAGAANDELGVEREQDRRRVGGGVGVRDRAADRAAVPHLRVADRADGLGEDRARGAQELVVLEVVVARERADRDRVAVLAHVREVGEPADVHQQLRPGDPEPHERQERVPAREELRVRAGAEELDRVVDGLGELVVEGCGDHFAPPSCSARQTFSGLAGIVTSVTP